MLPVSLQLFSGVSAAREQALWRAGVETWDDFERFVSPQASLLLDDPIAQSPAIREIHICRSALAIRDTAFFADRLDRSEHYRIAMSFPEDCLFLDIETTGLSRYYDQITVIGWRIAGRHGFHVQGQPDSEFRAALANAKCVVTFNGTLFDIPFIKEAQTDLSFPPVHVDLRFLAKRVGLTGGQKQIETTIGVDRSKAIHGMSGEFAPVLWHRYVSGDLSALQTLLEYNLADIDGLVSIFEHVTTKLAAERRLPVTSDALATVYQRLRSPTSSSGLQELRHHLIPYPRTEEKPLRIEDIVFVDRSPRLKVVGIDLTGSEERATGWCLLNGREAITARVHTDEELIALTLRERPHIVSIDSPLSLPEGRIRVDDSDPGRDKFGIMRYSERVLKRRGVNVYPALLPSMQRLTARGIELAGKFRKLGLPVIESYPGAAQDIMRIPRKRKGLEYLEQGLASFGVSGVYVKGGVSHDELDAITSAVVGVFFWASMMERLGPDPLEDEGLVIPDLRVDAVEARNRLVIGVSGALGAGKTTGARFLERLGYRYCRYSEVIERLVAAKKRKYTRSDLQTEGERINLRKGQRWLGRELMRPLLKEKFLVVDGLRFPEDHAFLTEVFGSQFLHIHVVAPRSVRRRRFAKREGGVALFDRQEQHMVESQFESMETLARDIVANQGSVEEYVAAIEKIVLRDWRD
jgi:uncharacterized protein YprB with RNaseH-like and TPR domain/predicted nuclease with RNAse H fold/dephospho-CoA kinase